MSSPAQVDSASRSSSPGHQNAPAALERAAGTSGEHAVAVGAAARVTASVECPSGRLGREHGEVVVQQAVQAQRIDRLVRVAGDLPPGVHAAVGAAGDGQPEGLAVGARGPEDQLQHALELSLHGALAGLGRPAREPRAVVLDGELRDTSALRVCPRSARPRAQLQTSSMKTISVESLLRGPSFRMRV